MEQSIRWVTVVLMIVATTCVTAKERSDADINCKPTDQHMTYDCMIMLRGQKSKIPITSAEFKVSADMPSMPGAHNIKSVPANVDGMPGMYNVRVQLEMYGEWVLKLDFTKPQRDRIVKKVYFGGAHGQVGHEAKVDAEHGDHGKKK